MKLGKPNLFHTSHPVFETNKLWYISLQQISSNTTTSKNKKLVTDNKMTYKQNGYLNLKLSLVSLFAPVPSLTVFVSWGFEAPRATFHLRDVLAADQLLQICRLPGRGPSPDGGSSGGWRRRFFSLRGSRPRVFRGLELEEVGNCLKVEGIK